MAVCAFDVTFTGNPAELLDRARAAIQARGGTLTGDATKGQVNVPVLGSRVAGSYEISGNVAHFEISEKPLLVSCGLIKTTLTNLAAPPAPRVEAPRALRATPARAKTRKKATRKKTAPKKVAKKKAAKATGRRKK